MAEGGESGGMLQKHKNILKSNREVLRKDLQAKNLLSHLSKVLHEEDYEEVKCEKTRFDQNEKLLDLLPRRGPEAFECFVNALWKRQSHLAKMLSKDAGLPERSEVEENNEFIIPEDVKSKLRSYQLQSMLNQVDIQPIFLLMKYVLSDDYQNIVAQKTKLNKIEECLTILSCKGLEAFEHFIEVLKMHKHDNIVKYLTDEPVTKDHPESRTNNAYGDLMPHPVDQTPISHVQHKLGEFCQITNQNGNWKKLAQQGQLPIEKYIGQSGNPTYHILKDLIEKHGDLFNVMFLVEMLQEQHMNESKECLKKTLNYNEDATDSTLTKPMNALSLADHSDKTMALIPGNVHKLQPKKLVEFRRQLAPININFNINDVSKIRAEVTPELRRLKEFKKIEWMKENLPAGVTGPMLDENMNVRDMPYRVRSRLTIALSGNNDWQNLAGFLGITPEEIRFFNRSDNPADKVLQSWETKSNSKIGDLYDILVGLGMAVIADKL